MWKKLRFYHKAVIWHLFSALVAAAPAQADNGRLTTVSQSITWLRLLHYVYKRSEITDPHFFLAADGSVNAEHELIADIAALKNDSNELPEEKRFACQFPARRRLIETQFHFQSQIQCPNLESWRARMKPDTVSFVYASQYINNPASAFGHGLLRFDRAERTGLLGYTLNYFADVDQTDSKVTYALKGLLGGYDGVYRFDYYYPKTHGYNTQENRGLWEYQLKLSAEERTKIFEHSWELVLQGRTPYYFLNRNCTYQLLSLIDVLNDNWNLAQQADGFFSSPQEAIKILDRAGLIENRDYRPSMRQQALEQFEHLNLDQRGLVSQVILGAKAPESITDPEVSSTIVATLAMNDGLDTPSGSALFSRATNARAKLAVTPQEPTTALHMDLDPAQGHDTLRVSLGEVHRATHDFMQIGFRPALHALNDLPNGFLPNTQLVFFDMAMRTNEQNQLSFYRADFINIQSLQPRSPIVNGLSWSYQMALQPMAASLCNECRAYRNSLLGGVAFDFLPRTTVYTLAGPTIDVFRPENRLAARSGASLSLGLISHLRKNLSVQASERFDDFLTGAAGVEHVATAELTATWNLSKNFSAALTSQYTQSWGKAVNTTTPSVSEIDLTLSQSY